MPIQDLKGRIARLPEQPGVYLYSNEAGETLYVGKASLLRDDKNYPYLQLTTGEAFPRVLIARSVAKDDHYYAGPFMPAKLGRKTMALTHQLFGIRSCNEVITGERARPCLEYDIRRCIAPCVREICSPDAYAAAVAHTRLFLEGRNDELVA